MIGVLAASSVSDAARSMVIQSTMTEHLPSSIAEAGEWLRSGRTTSVGLTEDLLARSKAAQDTIAAFITITDDAAMAAAQRADAELASGHDRGPLHGIPLGIKDIIATVDAPSTANSRVLDPAWGQRDDATTVRKLREAGAVLLGKTGLHEFAIGWPDPETGFRIPKNPWDLARTPGGSSSGTGAAVAAGLILGGLGTDTGGSIRGPAAYCGISGIKPTFGRVSKEGCVPLGYSLDNIGPMARTVYDCAVMLQVLAGFDPLDPCSVSVAVPDMLASLDGSVAGLRIGVPREHFLDVPELNAEVKQAVLAALDRLAAAGATVVDVELPHGAIAQHAQRAIMFGEAYAYHEPDLQTRPELYGKYTRQAIQQGAFYSAADYVQAQRVRSFFCSEVARVLAGRRRARHPDRAQRRADLRGLRPGCDARAAVVHGPVERDGPARTERWLRLFGSRTPHRTADHWQTVRRADGLQSWRRVSAPDGLAHAQARDRPGGTARMSDMTPEQIKQAVDAVLASARLPLTGEDYERLLRNYPMIQAQMAALRFPEMRYSEPAVIFPAPPTRYRASDSWQGKVALGNQRSAAAVRRGLDAVELGVLAAAGHQVFVGADFDQVGAVEDDDDAGHAHGAEAVRDQDRDAAEIVWRGAIAVARTVRRGGVALEQGVLGLGVERGGRLVEDQQQRLVAHEAARQGELLPLAERHLHAVWPGRAELGLEAPAARRATSSCAPARLMARTTAGSSSRRGTSPRPTVCRARNSKRKKSWNAPARRLRHSSAGMRASGWSST